jgi:hypothetical protein
MCDLVQLPFRILFSANRKLKAYKQHHLKVAKRSAKFYEDTELHKIEQLKI